jgi:hypothetical protein
LRGGRNADQRYPGGKDEKEGRKEKKEGFEGRMDEMK